MSSHPAGMVGCLPACPNLPPTQFARTILYCVFVAYIMSWRWCCCISCDLCCISCDLCCHVRQGRCMLCADAFSIIQWVLEMAMHTTCLPLVVVVVVAIAAVVCSIPNGPHYVVAAPAMA
jgi:hypothetical protein